MVFAVALLALGLGYAVVESITLAIILAGAGAALLLWCGVLLLVDWLSMARFDFSIAPRKQHYIQALVQSSVLLYWGFYWPSVYQHSVLILAQILFAYGFSILLSWSRREPYILGFGPVPIIFSINLFLWFKDEWFYLQFVMIAIGFLGKEFVRWQRDGKRVHIFNPSAFALGIFSLLLIATGTTALTWGPEIASTLTLAPNIYLFLFLAGLVVMYFFSITLVAMCAAATLFGLSALYSTITGVPYFLDSEIPAAVFLGLHLLITDPSTSPRSLLGKAIFGVLYGIGVFGLYSLLGSIGAPTFYDKLLVVPVLNLSVIAIDQFVQWVLSKNQWRTNLPPQTLNLRYMAVWILFFGTMALLNKTDGRHTGDSIPFWQQSCAEKRTQACERLLLLEETYCRDGSGWACNELGLHYRQSSMGKPDPRLADQFFARACELRFQAACVNVLNEEAVVQSNPKTLDLRLLLRQGGQNLMAMNEPELMARACEHGWTFACVTVSSR